MRRSIYCGLVFLMLCLTANTIQATEEEIDPELKPLIGQAKEYVANKYNCDINDLTITDSMIGRSGAYIDIDHGYDTERVELRRKDFESDWEVEGSRPAHQY